MIQAELEAFGLKDEIKLFNDGSFAVVLPATAGLEKVPHVAFAAHLDTYFNFPGGATPIVHGPYSGGGIMLPNNNIIISDDDLSPFTGKRIITADGTTLLGGDDKAGVASLVTMIENILTANTPHGRLTFWFCVDEEIGQLDVNLLPIELVTSWDVLWTVDGEEIGTIDVGSFVCRKMEITFTGMDAHPGVGGKNLKPAHYAAAAFIARTANERPLPMETSGLEGFIYCPGVTASASEAKIFCMPRYFDTADSDDAAKDIIQIANDCAERFGVKVEIKDIPVTVNTRAAIDKALYLVSPGVIAHQKFCTHVTENDVRGGTDGGMINLMYPNLPAPNMGTGAKNLHGPLEFVVLEDLEQVPLILGEMISRYASFQAEG